MIISPKNLLYFFLGAEDPNLILLSDTVFSSPPEIEGFVS
jgi:hypothetical protein